ncbi:MAG: HDIG domain-containing protein [Clostridia bacterium]|nr:HDIG domain-containing protein [Clostridia bacterium]
MIDDIKDLSLIQKQKKLKRRSLSSAFWKTFPLAFVASVGMSLFGIMITGEFLEAFTIARAFETAGRIATSVFIMIAMFFSVHSFAHEEKFLVRNFTLVTIIVAMTYMACMATVYFFNVYIMPISLVSLILLVLTNRKTSLIATCGTALFILISFISPNKLETTLNIYGIIASIVCNLVAAVCVNSLASKHYTRLKFLVMSAVAAFVSVPLVVITTLAIGDVSLNIVYNLAWSYGGNVGAVLLSLPLCAIFEGIFNIADDFKLNELTALSHPLLKRLASEAPGTFNHSLVVGNLAEACAEAIGENPHLARCAAYYHDVGKLKAPVYFSENQSNYNPHDELIPEVSASMITSHTLFGEILAKKYRLPKEIISICREHHGTTPVGYFYRKALSLTEDGDLPSVDYVYSGPKPQSKVAAIIMIADTIEATCRSFMPDVKEEFVAMVDRLVGEKLNLGQFDECPITLDDLNKIKETIIDVLPSVHHSRVSYDKRK